MVVGWTASDGELADLGLHRHCWTCFNVRKCRDRDACPVVECGLGCGWLYHACKQEEHLLLCPLQRVSCLNAGYGCDQEMARQDLTSHLLSCPASVLSCSQEWNRWPLHSRDRWKTVPFRQRNPRALRGQLDYELALRDQAMVGEFYKVPRRTRLALRNNLTRRYPALPVPVTRTSNPTDKSLSSLKESARYEVGDENILDKAVYGVAKIFLRNQEQQERRWKEDLDNAIQRTGKPVPKAGILKIEQFRRF